MKLWFSESFRDFSPHMLSLWVARWNHSKSRVIRNHVTWFIFSCSGEDIDFIIINNRSTVNMWGVFLQRVCFIFLYYFSWIFQHFMWCCGNTEYANPTQTETWLADKVVNSSMILKLHFSLELSNVTGVFFCTLSQLWSSMCKKNQWADKRVNMG